MADGFNEVTLLGNVGDAPQLRALPHGNAVLKFRLATTVGFLDSTGKRQEKVAWHTIAIWGKRGEALASMIVKGSRLFIRGRLEYSSYHPPAAPGVTCYATEIVASEVLFAGGKRADAPAAGSSPSSPPGARRSSAPPPAVAEAEAGGGDEIPF